MIDKIAKLLAKADRASTQEEANAYFEAAQRLSTTYSIDLARARQHTAHQQKRETPVRRTMIMEDFGRNTKKHLVRLYHIIAMNNDILIDISNDSQTVYPYGFPSDLEMADALFAVLAPQMVRAADDFIRAGDYKQETDWRGKPVDGRVARTDFYLGFQQKIKARLEIARNEAITEAVEERGTGTELVLADKSREVRDFHKAASDAKGTWGGPSSTSFSATARGAGTKAGERASMGSGTAIGGHKAVTA